MPLLAHVYILSTVLGWPSQQMAKDYIEERHSFRHF